MQISIKYIGNYLKQLVAEQGIAPIEHDYHKLRSRVFLQKLTSLVVDFSRRHVVYCWVQQNAQRHGRLLTYTEFSMSCRWQNDI